MTGPWSVTSGAAMAEREDSPSIGSELTLDIGSIAHGGFCVARHQGQVLFVRHTLPGERVRARVTELGPGGRYLRADAIEVLSSSADRVAAPCRYAGPGGCGGCDFQHVSLPAQRILKADVVREQLQRLAGLDVEVTVESVPGDRAGLRWRTRTEFAIDPDGQAGMHPHRSHEVLPLADCLIADERVIATGVLGAPHPGSSAVDVVAPSVGDPLVMELPPRQNPPVIEETVHSRWLQRTFELSARGFWQVHPGAAGTFVDAALDLMGPAPGETVLDLYSGVGVFAAALAESVGSSGRVIAVEADAVAARHAAANLAGRPQVVAVTARVDDFLGLPRSSRRGQGRRRPTRAVPRHPLAPPRADLVLLDPPRTGAGGGVVSALASMQPRAIVYVACDPAALARDIALFREHGYHLCRLRAFDAFPMTHHVECVALLTKSGSDPR